MASIGQLAAGVAHEINNPLSYIMNNLETLQEYIQYFQTIIASYDSKNEEVVKAAKSMDDYDFVVTDIDKLIIASLEGAEHVKEIVHGLKSFSRIDEAQKSYFSLNDCVEQALLVIHNELKYKCKLIKRLDVTHRIYGYPGQINQVILNLLHNAAQAITEQGAITIHTQQLTSKVCLTITDTGNGIEKDNIKKLFNPFYTTKDVGEGTGLGLSIAYGIIKHHNGNIDVKSELGTGTTFTITIPCDSK